MKWWLSFTPCIVGHVPADPRLVACAELETKYLATNVNAARNNGVRANQAAQDLAVTPLRSLQAVLGPPLNRRNERPAPWSLTRIRRGATARVGAWCTTVEVGAACGELQARVGASAK